ncbi:uncharacterized protein A4U43_C01F32800 [Asparagus officinalis]|uniref:Uncharacterized protein n=1 Tax=Asparagus officinalis TaxID=4686 RepID=A0A5P1FXC3_ASPOF|nr:uncharacterized protein A4U43_C01F32800 [Asparagus officinalis]
MNDVNLHLSLIILLMTSKRIHESSLCSQLCHGIQAPSFVRLFLNFEGACEEEVHLLKNWLGLKAKAFVRSIHPLNATDRFHIVRQSFQKFRAKGSSQSEMPTDAPNKLNSCCFKFIWLNYFICGLCFS